MGIAIDRHYGGLRGIEVDLTLISLDLLVAYFDWADLLVTIIATLPYPISIAYKILAPPLDRTRYVIKFIFLSYYMIC